MYAKVRIMIGRTCSVARNVRSRASLLRVSRPCSVWTRAASSSTRVAYCEIRAMCIVGYLEQRPYQTAGQQLWQ